MQMHRKVGMHTIVQQPFHQVPEIRPLFQQLAICRHHIKALYLSVHALCSGLPLVVVHPVGAKALLAQVGALVDLRGGLLGVERCLFITLVLILETLGIILIPLAKAFSGSTYRSPDRFRPANSTSQASD